MAAIGKIRSWGPGLVAILGLGLVGFIAQDGFSTCKGHAQMDSNTAGMIDGEKVAYQDYQTAVEAYEISKAVLDSAKENERVAMKSYEVGKGDILNVLTATSQMSDARQGFVNAFYSVLISKANLYRAIGRF